MDSDSKSSSCPRCGHKRDWQGLCPACVIANSLVSSSEADTPSQRQIKDYTLQRELGRGGMGTVWEALDRRLGRKVAVKRLHGDLTSDETARERLRREARTAARLRHRGIVSLLEFLETEDELVLVYEYVSGGTLAERLKAGPVPPRESAELLMTLAEAVTYAHQEGVIHRDLKPSNVLLDASRGGAPLLTDFGIARDALDDRSLTRTLQGLGTVSYIAPEQALGARDHESARTDVYGLGAVLFHCLTGRAPFLGANPASVVHAVIHEDPPAPRSLNPTIPLDLATICLKCLEKTSARRYATAGEVRAELERFLRGETIHARPIGTIAQAWRWARRHPALAVLLGVGFMGGLAVTGQWLRTEQLASRLGRELTSARRLRAETALEQQRGNEALAVLAQALRLEPRDRFVATRLADLLSRRAWPRPIFELGPHEGHLQMTAYSPDGAIILTSDGDGNIRRWDARSGSALSSHWVPGSDDWRGRGFTPDGRFIWLWLKDGSVRVWPQEGGAPVLSLESSKASVIALALRADGQGLAVATQKNVEAWRWGDQAAHFERPQPGDIRVLAWSADGGTLAGGDTNGLVRVWEIESKTELSRWQMDSAIAGLSFNESGKVLAITSQAGKGLLWDWRANVVLKNFDCLPGNPAQFLGDGKRLLIRDPVRGILLETLGTASSVAQDGDFNPPFPGWTVSADGVRVLATKTGQDLHLLRLDGGEDHSEPIRARWSIEDVAISPDGRRVVVCAGTNTAVVWETGLLSRAGQRLQMAENTLAVTFNSDSRQGVCCLSQGSLKRIDLAHPEAFTVISLEHGSLDSAAFTLDARLVAAVNSERQLAVFNVANGEKIAGPCDLPGAVSRLAFSRSGDCLAIGTQEGQLALFDVQRGPIAPPLTLHDGNPAMWGGRQVLAVEFSPNDRWIAIATYDNLVTLVQAATGVIQRRQLFPAPVSRTSFSPEGDHILTACWNGAAQVWHTVSGEPAGPPLPNQ